MQSLRYRHEHDAIPSEVAGDLGVNRHRTWPHLPENFNFHIFKVNGTSNRSIWNYNWWACDDFKPKLHLALNRLLVIISPIKQECIWLGQCHLHAMKHSQKLISWQKRETGYSIFTEWDDKDRPPSYQSHGFFFDFGTHGILCAFSQPRQVDRGPGSELKSISRHWRWGWCPCGSYDGRTIRNSPGRSRSNSRWTGSRGRVGRCLRLGPPTRNWLQRERTDYKRRATPTLH